MKDSVDLKTAAVQLLDRSVSDKRSLAALVAGIKTAYHQIQLGLGTSIGPSNIRMLMARAAYRASSRHPFLHDVGVYEDDLDAEVVAANKSDSDYDEIRAAFEDLYVTFWENLADMVGRKVAKVLMDEVVENVENWDRQEGKI